MRLDDHSLYTEKALQRRVAEGDTDAFRALHDLYRNKIFSLGLHLTRSETMAEEIVQDVFLKLWEKRAELTAINYLNAWIRTVARNACISYLRALAVEQIGLATMASRSDSSVNTTENQVLGREYDRLLQEAIQLLPPQRQRIYLMSRQQGLKQEDIARQLGISVFTVKEHMKLAIRHLRKYMEERIELCVMLGILLHLS